MESEVIDKTEVNTVISKERVLTDTKNLGEKMAEFVEENFQQKNQLGIIATMASLQDEDGDDRITGVNSSVAMVGNPMACTVALASCIVDFYQRISKEKMGTSGLEDTIRVLGSIATNILAQRERQNRTI